MTRRNWAIALRQMLDMAVEAEGFATGRSKEGLRDDRLFQLAMTRLIEMIGEAANRIPVAERNKYPTVQWHAIIGMRNALIHGYDIIDIDRLWDAITNDVPILVRELREIVEAEA